MPNDPIGTPLTPFPGRTAPKDDLSDVQQTLEFIMQHTSTDHSTGIAHQLIDGVASAGDTSAVADIAHYLLERLHAR